MRRTFDFDRVSSLSSRSATLISQHLGNLVVRKQTGVTSSSRSQVGGGGEGRNESFGKYCLDIIVLHLLVELCF